MWLVGRPDDPVGRCFDESAGIGDRIRPGMRRCGEVVVVAKEHPPVRLLERVEHELEAGLIGALREIHSAEMVDHDGR